MDFVVISTFVISLILLIFFNIIPVIKKCMINSAFNKLNKIYEIFFILNPCIKPDEKTQTISQFLMRNYFFDFAFPKYNEVFYREYLSKENKSNIYFNPFDYFDNFNWRNSLSWIEIYFFNKITFYLLEKINYISKRLEKYDYVDYNVFSKNTNICRNYSSSLRGLGQKNINTEINFLPLKKIEFKVITNKQKLSEILDQIKMNKKIYIKNIKEKEFYVYFAYTYEVPKKITVGASVIFSKNNTNILYHANDLSLDKNPDKDRLSRLIEQTLNEIFFKK